MADIGRARTPAAPDTDGRARTPAAPQMDVVVAPGMCALPSRKPLDHRGPLWVDVSDAIYFITIAAAERGGTMLIDNADTIMNAARFYQDKAKWFLYLFLIMPDHIHMLVHVPPTSQLSDVIGHWKSYLATQKGIRFQVNFFDTRIRDAAHYAEKWNYICQNPVARGLVEAPREWKYVIHLILRQAKSASIDRVYGAPGVRALPCGDSDSIGAVFGQIAGAYYGFDAIPERWVKAVKATQEF